MPHKSDIDFEQVRRLVRRRGPIVLLLTVIAAGVGLALSEVATKKYTATASLLFSNTQANQQVAGLTPNYNPNAQAQQDTNLQLVQIGDMPARTASLLGHGLTALGVAGAMSISAVGDTNVVDVSATSTSPVLAARIANTYATTFVDEQVGSNQHYYASALAAVTRQLAALPPDQRNGAVALSLETRAQSLSLLSSLRSGVVQVARPAALPTSPSFPKKKLDLAVAVVLGLLIGLAIAYLLERLDHTIRDGDELTGIFGVPLLGSVPQSASLALERRGANSSSSILTAGAERESFSLIRAHLRYFNVDRELRTLLVTSAQTGDGKTTVACHLGAAAAMAGGRVLLIEADLRLPTMDRQFDLTPAAGLSEVLIGTTSFDDAVQTIQLQPDPGLGPSSLDVLVAGAVPPNPAELIESQAMRSLVEEARSRYDIVILDTPPITAVSDALPLLLTSDGVILVGRIGTDRRLAVRARDILSEVQAPLLGIVVNGVTATGSYGYDAYSQQLDVYHSPSGQPNGRRVIERTVSRSKR